MPLLEIQQQSKKVTATVTLEQMLRVANTFDISVEELLPAIKPRQGPGFGSKGYYQRHPSSKDD